MIRALAVKQSWHMLLEPAAISKCEIKKSHRTNCSQGTQSKNRMKQLHLYSPGWLCNSERSLRAHNSFIPSDEALCLVPMYLNFSKFSSSRRSETQGTVISDAAHYQFPNLTGSLWRNRRFLRSKE